MSNFARTVFQAVVLLITINVVGLWIFSFLQQKKLTQLQTDQTLLEQQLIDQKLLPEVTHTSVVSVAPSPTVTLSNQHDQQLSKRLTQVEQQLDQLQRSVDKVSTTSSAQTESEVAQIKEHTIFLGTGSTTSTSWQELDSTSISIDTSKYPTIIQVTFEAGMSIIGGEVRARLINKTTGAILTNTEVMHNTSITTWKTSQPFTLATGENNYVVQLRSSSGEKANLNGARIKITVQ